MSLADLGKRLWKITQQHGKELLKDVEKDLLQKSPRWDQLRIDLKHHGKHARRELTSEMRSWLEQELRKATHRHKLWSHDPEMERSYLLLGLPYGSKPPQVKQRWRQLLKNNHPDRYMHDPVAYKQATKTTQELTAAYHMIVKAFDEGGL